MGCWIVRCSHCLPWLGCRARQKARTRGYWEDVSTVDINSVILFLLQYHTFSDRPSTKSSVLMVILFNWTVCVSRDDVPRLSPISRVFIVMRLIAGFDNDFQAKTLRSALELARIDCGNVLLQNLVEHDGRRSISYLLCCPKSFLFHFRFFGGVYSGKLMNV